MVEHHRNLNILLTVAIIGFSIFIVHRFIPSLLWAGIISMMTYPLYQRWLKICIGKDAWAALSFSFIVSVVIFLPLFWLITVLVQESKYFITFLMVSNKTGIQPPQAIISLPKIGQELEAYWLTHFAKPGAIKAYFSSISVDLSALSFYAKAIGVSVVHRSVQIGFTLLSLFFFYRDMDILIKQINQVGAACLGERWHHFSGQLPKALQGTVNGTVVVGAGVGVIMTLVYWMLAFPAPTIAGFFTGVAAMIPFAVPFVFGIVAFFIWLTGSLVKAIVLLAIGTVVMFIADHFVKPVLIGGTTELHFLAVLFGLLGGVETLGLIGLFMGPMMMVLLVTLWRESAMP